MSRSPDPPSGLSPLPAHSRSPFGTTFPMVPRGQRAPHWLAERAWPRPRSGRRTPCPGVPRGSCGWPQPISAGPAGGGAERRGRLFKVALAGWRSRRTIPRSSWGSRASSRYGRRREAAGGTPGAAAGAAPAPRAASPPHPGNGAPRSALRFAPPLSEYRALIGPQPPRHWPAELSLRAAAPCPRRVPRRAGTGASRAPLWRGAQRAGPGARGSRVRARGAPRGHAGRVLMSHVAGSPVPRGAGAGGRALSKVPGGEERLWDGAMQLPSCRVGWRDAPGGRLANLTRQCQRLVSGG